MATIGNVNRPYRLGFSSYKILPLVYDEALSYWQQIIQLCEKLNEVIGVLSTLDTDFEQANQQTLNAAKAYADSIAQALQTDFSNLAAKVEEELNAAENERLEWESEFLSEYQQSFTELKADVEKELQNVQLELAEVWLAMNYLFFQQDAYHQKLYASLKEYIDKTVAATTGAAIRVQNPITGSITSLNVALQDLLDYWRTIGSITVAQYASLNLTMEEYAAYNLTVEEYAKRAFFIFFDRLMLGGLTNYVESNFEAVRADMKQLETGFYMRNPYIGEKSLIKDVVRELVGITSGAPMVYEYKNYTSNFNQVSYYKNLNLTPSQYRKQGLAEYFGQNISPVDEVFTELNWVINGNMMHFFGTTKGINDPFDNPILTCESDFFYKKYFLENGVATIIPRNEYAVLLLYTKEMSYYLAVFTAGLTNKICDVHIIIPLINRL